MIYPKFPRRTLALILFCLLITLGAVGILFLVYFFNESNALLMDSSLKTIYGEQQQQQYRKNIIGSGEYIFEQKPTNRYAKDVEGSVNQVRIGNNNQSSMQQTSSASSSSSDEELAILATSASQEFEPTSHNKLSKTINSKASNMDTIYIDDFDRPQTFNTKSKSEPSNIDYFDTILVDHKDETIKNPQQMDRLEETSIEYHENKFLSSENSVKHQQSSTNSIVMSNDNERKSRINSKRREGSRWNKSKLFRYTKIKSDQRDDDDGYDLEIDSPGSGSGDFIDDTEINEIFTKKINSMLARKKNESKKSNSVKFNRSRKKHRFNNANEYNSSQSRGFKMVTASLYPTLSSSQTISSPSSPSSTSLSELANKKWPAPALIHPKSIINESENLPTPSYNVQSQLELSDLGSTATAKVIENLVTNLRDIGSASENNEAWIETRTRRIMGNVKKSEERSRQLLLCEEAGGGELCRMLFKGHIND